MQSLTKRELTLLAIVASEELAAREVAQKYESEFSERLEYGSLYITFRKLREAKLVSLREVEDADGPIRYFKITAAGKGALREALRAQDAVEHGWRWKGAT